MRLDVLLPATEAAYSRLRRLVLSTRQTALAAAGQTASAGFRSREPDSTRTKKIAITTALMISVRWNPQSTAAGRHGRRSPARRRPTTIVAPYLSSGGSVEKPLEERLTQIRTAVSSDAVSRAVPA